MRRVRLVTAPVAVAVALTAGCTGSADETGATEAPEVVADNLVITVDPDIAPFCDAMSTLNRKIDAGELDLDDLAGEYRTIVPLVPVEIRAVFDAVADGVASPTGTSTTIDEVVVEATSDPTELDSVLALSPNEALADYLTLTCRRSDDNPGPAATQPP